MSEPDIEIPNPYGHVDLKKAEFLRSVVELSYDQLVADREMIRNRAFWFLGGIGTGLLLCLKFLTDEGDLTRMQRTFFEVEAIFLSVAGASLIITCIFPRAYPMKGMQAELALRPDNVSHGLPYIILAYCRRLQKAKLEIKKEIARMVWWVYLTPTMVFLSPILAYIVAIRLSNS